MHTVNINGVVGSFNGAGMGVFADAFTGTANITIGASGTVFSQNSAVFVQGAATITNNGIINSAGIGINKTGAAGALSLTNFGSIFGGSQEAIQISVNGTHNITNHGLISTNTNSNAINATGPSGIQTIVNYGTIRGDINLGGGADNVNNISGIINGIVFLGDGNDIFQGAGGSETADGGNNDDNLFGNGSVDVLGGGAGSDYIDGGSGADVMTGGADNDTYVVDNTNDSITEGVGEGTNDGVLASTSYVLASDDHIEILQTTFSAGTDAINLTGNALLAQNINGNDGNNILDGGIDTLADALSGALGDDTYVLHDQINDAVFDTGGTDTITSTIDRSLAGFADIENLTLLAGTAINATGNALENRVTGNSNDNVLDGGADLLVDVLTGLGGNDTYQLAASTNDQVVEDNTAGSGTDLITSDISRSLAGFANVENLTLLGTATDGTGNTLANLITGNAAANILNGGTDLLVDTLTGLDGDDQYVLAASTNDVIVEDSTAGSGIDTITSTLSRTLADFANVEKLTLLGTAASGTGNTLANTILGNASANTLNGGVDSLVDTLTGLGGNDTYVLGSSTNDVVVEASGSSGGSDTITSTISRSLSGFANVEKLTLLGTAASGTGNTLANAILGNASANTLNGGTDTLVDTLTGLGGNDTYVLGASTNDVVVEASGASGGSDTITSTISRSLSGFANVEKLTLLGTAASGTGNTLANAILGNASANTLNGGTDTLVDTLTGLGGNDTYVLGASTNDVVVEASGTSGGSDTITSTISRSLSGFANIEKLTLLGTASSGTGNTLANAIKGNASANTLNGGVDSLVDTLTGLGGNDTYVLGASTNDVVVEASGSSGGSDTITSTISRSLSGFANVEKLTLLGTASSGTGNALANTIKGNSSVNTINGGLGSDTLTGGSGGDTFIFNTVLGSSNIDRITDFTTADTIRLENSGTGLFNKLALNGLNPLYFKANTAGSATDSNDRIIYDTDSGALYYDSNGNASGGKVQFALLATKPVISAADFFVI